MRTALSTPRVASSDSRQAVTSPTPTTPITTRSSPSIEWTLYPNSSIRSQTWLISSRVACGRMDMIIAIGSFSAKNKKPTPASGLVSRKLGMLNPTPLYRFRLNRYRKLNELAGKDIVKGKYRAIRGGMASAYQAIVRRGWTWLAAGHPHHAAVLPQRAAPGSLFPSGGTPAPH